MHFSWSVALPNLLIGLREGLEAGLVVSILVAAVRRLAPGRSLAGVWTGVAGAVALSFSFGAVLTFTKASMSSRAQEIFGGTLSLLAVVLVTFMIFWMRRTARSMSGELKDKVGSALAMGGGALVATAFIAVAREGLETALFIWTNTQAAGSDAAPLIGAAIGLVVAVVLCAGMYRRVLKVNLARFFTYTGAVLIVIAAGVLSYGIGDLQDAGLVISKSAFDLSGHIPADTWWVQIIRGITNLAPQMSWLQVVAYLVFLAIVMAAFVNGARQPRSQPSRGPSPSPTPPTAAASAAGAGSLAPGGRAGGEETRSASASGSPFWRRGFAVGGAVVAVPALVAGGIVLFAHGSNGSADQKITLTERACVRSWTPPKSGSNVFSIENHTSRAVDVELVSAETSQIAAEIEVLGPGTTRDLPVGLASGRYQWRCVFDGAAVKLSAAADVTGSGNAGPTAQRRIPATDADMNGPLTGYAAFVRTQLDRLKGQVATLKQDAADGDLGKARADWLTAHLTWRRMGAAYNAFGDAGSSVDGLAAGLPGGTNDSGFAGFHKIEYDLWHGAPASAVTQETGALAQAVANLDQKLPTFTFDANDVSTRAHEILEDTLRFQLTGQDDYGSGSSLAAAEADLAGERVLLNLLAPLVNARSPGLVTTAGANFDAIQRALDATKKDGQWVAVKDLSLAQRQPVNASVGQAVETLSPIPDLLEIQKK